MPIEERDAILAAENFESFEMDDDKRFALKLIETYESEQRAAGQPLYPSKAKAQFEEAQKVRKLFTDETHGFDPDTLQAFRSTFGGDEEGKDGYLIDRFLSHRTGRPIQHVSAGRKYYRDEYAQATWGEPVKSDREFRDKLAADFDYEDSLSARAQETALAGGTIFDGLSRIEFEDLDNPAYKGREKQRKAEFERIFRGISEEIAPLSPIADTFVAELQNAMGVGESTGEPLPDDWFVQTVLDIPRDQRDSFFAIVQARAGEGEEKSLFQAMSERLGRRFGDMTRGGNLSLELDAIDTLKRQVIRNGIPEGGLPEEFGFSAARLLQSQTSYLLTEQSRQEVRNTPIPERGSDEWNALPEDTRAAIDRLDREKEFRHVWQQVNDIATGVVDPAQSSNVYGKAMLGLASMAPNVALMAAGPAGLTLNVAAYKSEAEADLFRRNPDMDPARMATVAFPTAVGKAMVDRIPLELIQGRLPMFNKWLETPSVTGAARGARTAARFGVGTVYEIGQEAVQDVGIPGVVEGIASALSEDVPNIPWSERLGAFTSDESLSELIPTVILLNLIGAGVGSIRDYKGGAALVGNFDLLVAAGASEAEANAIRTAADKGDLKAAQTLLRESLAVEDAKTGKKKPQGSAPEIVQKHAAAAIERATERARTISEAERVDLLPAIRNTAEGWSLQFQDGTARSFDSYADADAARWQFASDNSLSIHEATRSVMQTVESQLEQGREVAFVFEQGGRSLLQEVEAGEVSREAALNRVGIAEEQGGIERNSPETFNPEGESKQEFDSDPTAEYEEAFTAAELRALSEDDKLAAAAILGKNVSEYADGIQRTTIRLFQGASPLTVVEEKTEADADRMLRTGRREWLLSSLRQYEQASGDRVFLSDKADDQLTDGDIKEAYSHLAQSYFVGRSRKGDAGDRWQSRQFRKWAADVLRSPLGSAFEAYGRFFRSVWKRAAMLNKLRREGKLDADLERELARSVGLGEQAEYEAGVEAEAGAFRDELDEGGGFETEPEQASAYVPTDDAPFSVIPGTEGEGFQRLAMPDGRVLEGPASFSILAYHGTPHKVDRFSTEKIGTGEGVQAYGWGLYFAEDEGVARQYQSQLKPTRPKDADSAIAAAARSFIDSNGRVEVADLLDTYPDASTEAIEWGIREAEGRESGSVYTVELDANAEDFLDWDKPLREQSEKVQAAIERHIEAFPDGDEKNRVTGYLETNKPGRWFYTHAGATGFGDGDITTRALLAAGIRGIRYLDGNSRGSGEGSYNYVIFDESLIKIIAENGKPVETEASFSILPNAEARVAEMFSPFSRTPDQKRRIVQEVQRRATEAARGWQPILNAARTNKEIEEERKKREGEILTDKLDTLSPATLGALEASAQLDDVAARPILSELLTRETYTRKDGKTVFRWAGSLLSKTRAKERGVHSLAEWDDMPDGLPSYVFGGNLAPDQAAAQFGFDSVAEFWNALQSEIDTYQDIREQVENAQATVRNLEREARAESREWAEQQKAERRATGSDRAVLIGAMRTLDAMVSALPPEVRGRIGGFVKLAQFKTPGAMMQELERRAARINRELERWLKLEADEQVRKLLKRAVPAKDQAGKKRVGKAGAEIHDLFDLIRDVYQQRWSAEKAEGIALGFEDEIAGGELSTEEEAFKILAAEMVRLFGNWNEADSARRVAAYEAARNAWEGGYLDWQAKKAEEKEQRDEIRAELIEATGKRGTGGEKDLAKMTGAKPLSKGKDFMLSLLNFDQLAGWAFGENTPVARAMVDRQREAEAAKTDAVDSVLAAVEDHFTELAGGNRFEGEKLQYRMGAKQTITATDSTGDTRRLSELEALSVLLMWQQEDGQRHMRGKRDDDGNLVSSWSYDEDFVDQVSGQISPEGWATLAFLQEQYGQEYDGLNAVYSELHGVNLPRNANYSPLTVKPVQSRGGETVDPVTGSTVSSGSFTPGSLRSRGSATAEPDFRDALATFVAHRKQIEHWKAFAPFVRDAQAILGNREVGNSVEAAHGREAVSILRKWVDAFAQGGTRDAAAGLAAYEGMRKLVGNFSAMALVGRIGTLAVQATQLAAASAKMPAGAYTVRLSKLLTGRLEWKAAFDSPYIRRRLSQMPAVVQQAMEGLRAGKPSRLKHEIRKVGNLIGGADAIFTAGTYAIVYDYQFSQARKAGMDPLDAEAHARNEADRITDEIAQPTRLGARSYFEISSTNPAAKMVWAFASESRKNLGLMAFSLAKRDKVEAARAIAYVVLWNGLLSGVIRNAWRDARDDEDDEIFDDRNWNPQRLALTTATDWLFGFPVVGEEVQRAIYTATGEYMPDGGALSAVSDSIPAARRLLSGESKDGLRDAEKIFTAFGLFNDNAAALTSLMHLVRDTIGLGRNFFN